MASKPLFDQDDLAPRRQAIRTAVEDARTCRLEPIAKVRWQVELVRMAEKDPELSGFLRGLAAVARERPEVHDAVIELQYFAWLLELGGNSGVDPLGSTVW